MVEFTHKPVLLKETLLMLNPHSGQTFIDGTVGLGGHSSAICKLIAPDGRLLAIDRDSRNLELAKKKLASFGKMVSFSEGSYTDAKKLTYELSIDSVSGILLDIGYASPHVEDPTRGFSFQTEGPLDMRYDVNQELTASLIVNTWSAEEIAQIFRKYGEEQKAEDIAKAIVSARRDQPFMTTTQLAAFVAEVTRRGGRTHPATKVFQALRIAVNDELGELERALPDLFDLLEPGGRLAVISFHSLEDRIIKVFMKSVVKAGHGILINKHVIKPTQEEIRDNPRCRSAKLRVLERYDANHPHNKKKYSHPTDG